MHFIAQSKRVVVLLLVGLVVGFSAYGLTNGLADTIKQVRAADSLRLELPFAQESIWQSWRSNPDQMIVFEVRGLVHLFGTNRQKFLFQQGDTWFVYGLHGDTVLSNKPYGPDYEQWQGRHNGIDFITAPNLPVLAARDGAVIRDTNNFVIIDHGGGFQTSYGNLDNLQVTEGQNVTQGQIIGYSQVDTENSDTASMVHFSYDQVFEDGSVLALNPLRYLDLGQAIVPIAEANQFSSNVPTLFGGKGSDPLADPRSQPDFFWNHQDMR